MNRKTHTASLLKEMQGANWIWWDRLEKNPIHSFMQARRSFVLASVPRKAEVLVTADTRYRLYVNGQYVCQGPARGYQMSQPTDRMDLTPFLQKGRNAIAALVHCEGISTFQHLNQGAGGFILKGKAGTACLDTGSNWRVRQAPGYRPNITRVSIQLGFEEEFDARATDGDWTAPDYDDSGWLSRFSQRVAGGMPWHDFEPRGIPLLQEELVLPRAICFACAGENGAGAERENLNLGLLYFNELRAWKPVPGRNAAQVELPAAGEGKFVSCCLDFGKEVVGAIRLEVAGGAGGEIIDSTVCEGADAQKGPLFVSPEIDCRMSFANRLVLREGATHHEQFDYWGFRYLILTARGTTRPLTVRVSLRQVGYPLDIQAAFHSSSERLNRIYEAAVQTQKCCTLDAYVDCPWREQAQWWGDARVQGKNTFYLAADARLLRRGIRQIGTQQIPNGLTYGHAPTAAHGCILPDFTLTWIMTHWDYYYQTGDVSLFQEMKDRIVHALAYFEEWTGDNGLLAYDHRYWLFLDWAPVFKEGYSGIYNIFYFMTLKSAADLFLLIGERSEAAKCRRKAVALEKALRTTLWDSKRQTLHGGRDWKNRPVEQNSAHLYAIAILAGFLPEHHAEFAERFLLPLVAGDHKDPLTPSPFYMHYIFEALKMLGWMDAVVDNIDRWWGGMLDRGLTTFEEIWGAVPGHTSLCHAWSAHPIIHFSNILLGVWQEDVAWKRIRFAPSFCQVSAVEGKVATPHGPVLVCWKKEGARIRVSLALPRGISATVELPGRRREMVSGKKSWEVAS